MPAPGGRLAAQTAGGRPAARAAATPPRSTLRREIRGDESCSLMAGVLLTIGLAGRWLAPPGPGGLKGPEGLGGGEAGGAQGGQEPGSGADEQGGGEAAGPGGGGYD